MAWTAITDRDICIQGIGQKINCMASGTIKAGQGVYGEGSDSTYIYVKSGVATAGLIGKFIGIAAGDSTKGSPVAIYTAGSVCWTRTDSGVAQGNICYLDNDGEFDPLGSNVPGSGAVKALDTQASAAGLFRALVL